MTWLVSFPGEASHITPIDDLRPHVETPECWCKPTDDEGVWVHHSLDQRELHEEQGIIQ